MKKQYLLSLAAFALVAAIGAFAYFGYERGVGDANQAAHPTIEEYVAENISMLSPEKEVLGGRFYVTKIEAHGGTGTVEYEDGHIALTADFRYEIDADGEPRVTVFTVRK